ncbi:hypothetical protein ZIOFF_002586 [Zingiber officinale]|uniref:GTD-binding domain-containing protein n=1 Tax=Zingiber officinale TaxID=94328 RepID=A0A8J5HZZ5_ZINOF|nr:hypothetical protein ZIOFF_002586 [Zingiber officinale]
MGYSPTSSPDSPLTSASSRPASSDRGWIISSRATATTVRDWAAPAATSCKRTTPLRFPGWGIATATGGWQRSGRCSGFYSSYFLAKQSWSLTEYEQTKNLVDKVEVDDQEVLEKSATLSEEKLEEEEVIDSHIAKIFPGEEEEQQNEEDDNEGHTIAAILEEEEESSLISDACHLVQDTSIEVLTSTPSYICAEEDRLVPIELIDSMTEIPIVLVYELNDVKQTASIPEEEKTLIPSVKTDEGIEDHECSVTQGIRTETGDIHLENSMVPQYSKPISDQQVIAPRATTIITLEGLSEKDHPETKETAFSENHISEFSENHEIEEDRAPETPNYTDCIQDELKAALQAEQKVLSTLYAELEEERNATAIAANQTMAMITRLQEEKVAMQMEALQYHQMMNNQNTTRKLYSFSMSS